jgi:Ni,Fe-hydrogenase III small subunit
MSRLQCGPSIKRGDAFDILLKNAPRRADCVLYLGAVIRFARIEVARDVRGLSVVRVFETEGGVI